MIDNLGGPAGRPLWCFSSCNTTQSSTSWPVVCTDDGCQEPGIATTALRSGAGHDLRPGQGGGDAPAAESRNSAGRPECQTGWRPSSTMMGAFPIIGWGHRQQWLRRRAPSRSGTGALGLVAGHTYNQAHKQSHVRSGVGGLCQVLAAGVQPQTRHKCEFGVTCVDSVIAINPRPTEFAAWAPWWPQERNRRGGGKGRPGLIEQSVPSAYTRPQ